MESVFIYDNNEISISIIAKSEAIAKKILKQHVINPSIFVKENEIELDELEID